MNGAPLTLRSLPLSMKVLATFFLALIGIGYLMAIFYLFLVDIDPHRKQGRSTVQGIVLKYHGTRETTKLEASLRGAMSEYIAPADRDKLLAWLHEGASRESYEKVAPIFAKSCIECHSAEGQSPHLTSYEEVEPMTKQDLGLSVLRLVQVSHVHLFGIAFIFLLTGAIFSLCELREWLKVVIVAAPFFAMLLDIGSWWLTHYEAMFAYTVIAGGALMSATMPIQVFVPIYQMWFKRSAVAVIEKS